MSTLLPCVDECCSEPGVRCMPVDVDGGSSRSTSEHFLPLCVIR